MGTPFETVFDYFRMAIEDYRLDKVRATDSEMFYTRLRGLLTVGIPTFDCLKSLAFTSQEEVIDTETVTRYYFIETLDTDEIMIISKIMIEKWFERDVNDIRAYGNYMSQKEFKKESASQGLKVKDERLKGIVQDYMAEIRNYYGRHVENLDGWDS